MIDDYRQVLSDCRAPERVDSLMGIVEILFENGYEISLGEIGTLMALNDSSHDMIDQTESIIFSCYYSFLQSLGIDADKEMASKRPHLALELLQGMVCDIESFDDHDTLLAIAIDDTPPEMKLANILSFIHSTDMFEYMEMYHIVTKNTLEKIVEVLTAKANDEEDYELDGDKQIIDQITIFLSICTYSNARNILDDGGFNKSRQELIDESDLPTDEDYIPQLVWTVAGIILCEAKNYLDCYALIDEVLPLVDIEEKTDTYSFIGREVAGVLKVVFDQLPDSEYYEDLEDESY